MGLSPLVRGTGTRMEGVGGVPGSIPAGAGDGSSHDRSTSKTWVYPRWCGGRSTATFCEGRRTGLSPLVRGTGRVRGNDDVDLGSIPAGAGDGTTQQG